MTYLLICFIPLLLMMLIGGLCSRLDRRKKEREAESTNRLRDQQARTPTPPSPVEPHFSPDIPPAGWNPTHSKGSTLSEVTAKNAEPPLQNSKFMKDVMKSRTTQEQSILEMIQKGASIADIRSRYGPEAADGAQGILDKARAELEAKILPLVEAGMTMEDIVEKFGSSAAISSTVSPALTVETTPIPRARPSLEAPSPIIPDPTPAPEGGRKRKTHYAVVRSVKLRKAAIQIHGNNCCVCKFNFDEAFGEDLAQGYIEVHHLNGIASGVRNTDPATDLAPLCANCHAMADRLTRHHAAPPRSIDELRNLLSR